MNRSTAVTNTSFIKLPFETCVTETGTDMRPPRTPILRERAIVVGLVPVTSDSNKFVLPVVTPRDHLMLSAPTAATAANTKRTLLEPAADCKVFAKGTLGFGAISRFMPDLLLVSNQLMSARACIGSPPTALSFSVYMKTAFLSVPPLFSAL